MYDSHTVTQITSLLSLLLVMLEMFPVLIQEYERFSLRMVFFGVVLKEWEYILKVWEGLLLLSDTGSVGNYSLPVPSVSPPLLPSGRSLRVPSSTASHVLVVDCWLPEFPEVLNGWEDRVCETPTEGGSKVGPSEGGERRVGRGWRSLDGTERKTSSETIPLLLNSKRPNGI